MRCPNCFHALTHKQLGKIEVEHCDNCGGTVFEANEINRITLQEAHKLADMKQSDVISGNEKFSPRDGSKLERIEDDSIPQFVTLLKSKTTGEVFAYPDDLIHFKSAQKARVNYYKLWNIPVPALKNVLLYSFIIVSSLSVIYLTSRLQGPVNQRIQAKTLCSDNLIISSTENQIIVSCQTDEEYTSEVDIQCDGQTRRLTVNTKPSLLHLVTLSKTCASIKYIFNDHGSIIESDTISLR